MKIQNSKKKGNSSLKIIGAIGAILVVFWIALIVYGTMGGGTSDEANTSDLNYTDAVTLINEYQTNNEATLPSVEYLAPLLVNYRYYYPDTTYTEQEILTALDTFELAYQPILDKLPLLDEEGEVVYLQAPEETQVYQIFDNRVNITPQEEAMMFELILELPLYENNSISIEQDLRNNINMILMKYANTDEDYSLMVNNIETTGFINIYNDSEEGFNIPELDTGDVAINENDIASSTVGNSYPETDANLTGNLRVCYLVPESGNYAFQAVEGANESIYGVYDDYADCIKGKYQLSSVPKLGYSKSNVNTNSIADGEIKKDELYEVMPITGGQYVELSGVQVQKLTDNAI